MDSDDVILKVLTPDSPILQVAPANQLTLTTGAATVPALQVVPAPSPTLQVTQPAPIQLTLTTGPQLSNVLPIADGTPGTAGTSHQASRGDHQHPAEGAARALTGRYLATPTDTILSTDTLVIVPPVAGSVTVNLPPVAGLPAWWSVMVKQDPGFLSLQTTLQPAIVGGQYDSHIDGQPEWSLLDEGEHFQLVLDPTTTPPNWRILAHGVDTPFRPNFSAPGDTLYSVDGAGITVLPIGTAGQFLAVHPSLPRPTWADPRILTDDANGHTYRLGTHNGALTLTLVT